MVINKKNLIQKIYKYLNKLNKKKLENIYENLNKVVKGGLTNTTQEYLLGNPVIHRQEVGRRVIGLIDQPLPVYQGQPLQSQPLPSQPLPVYQRQPLQSQPLPSQPLPVYQRQPLPSQPLPVYQGQPLPVYQGQPIPVGNYQHYLPMEQPKYKSLSMPKINKNCYIINIDVTKQYRINELLFPNKYEKHLNVQVSVDAYRLYQIIINIMEKINNHKKDKKIMSELTKFRFVCYSLKIFLTSDTNYINRVFIFFKYYLDQNGYKDKYNFDTNTNELKIDIDNDNELRVFLTYNKLFGTIDIKIAKETNKDISVSKSKMMTKSLNITQNRSYVSSNRQYSSSNDKRRSISSSDIFKSK